MNDALAIGTALVVAGLITAEYWRSLRILAIYERRLEERDKADHERSILRAKDSQLSEDRFNIIVKQRDEAVETLDKYRRGWGTAIRQVVEEETKDGKTN